MFSAKTFLKSDEKMTDKLKMKKISKNYFKLNYIQMKHLEV